MRMKIRFQRVKSFLGFKVSMKIIVNGEVVYRLKNGEVFNFETNDLQSLTIKTHRFIFDLDIPVDEFKDNVDILLQYQFGLCKNSTQAICSENGKLIGVYPNKEVKK